jgi:hypothetical protein
VQSGGSNGPVGASTSVIGGFGGYEPVRGSADAATGNGGPARVNNSVKYESPSFSGFKAGAVYGLGEVAGSTTKTRVLDVYGRYTAGALDAMVSLVDVAFAAIGLRTDRRTGKGSMRLALRPLRRDGRVEGHVFGRQRAFVGCDQFAAHHDRHRRGVALGARVRGRFDHAAVDDGGQQHRQFKAQLVGAFEVFDRGVFVQRAGHDEVLGHLLGQIELFPGGQILHVSLLRCAKARA